MGTTSALALACPSIFSGAFIRETEPPQLQSRAHFYDLIFQKWLALLPRSIFWNEIESSSRYSLARFLATALPDRGPQPRKHRPYLSKATVPYRTCKNTGIRPSITSPGNSHPPGLLLSSTASTCQMLLLPLGLTRGQDSPWTFVRNVMQHGSLRAKLFQLPDTCNRYQINTFLSFFSEDILRLRQDSL